jgi:hypothetical protein
MKVMALESGQIVFLGDPEEFKSSTIPAVLQLTHFVEGMHFTDSRIADPWRKARELKENQHRSK